jgi:tRNA (guanine37-N1)-methyltransferase
MLQIDAVTLFPPMFDAVTEYGVTGRARERKLFELVLWNPRDFAGNAYRSIDDRPYGGGPGMVMMAEPLEKAVLSARQRQRSSGVVRPRIVHLTPQGRLLDHERVAELSREQGLVMLAGRYEGVDERLVKRVVDDEVSIGDYVLSGGELAAMVLIDCVVRQLPGALGDRESAGQDSFATGLLDHPHYTRPEVYEGVAVPQSLTSGNHAEIARWRLKQALGRTWQRRPDLLAKRNLSAAESALLDEYRKEMEGA